MGSRTKNFSGSSMAVAVATLVLAGLLFCPATRGDTYTWSSTAASGDWGTDANWTPFFAGVTPGANDTAMFSGASTITAIVPDANRYINSISINGNIGYTIGTAGGNALLLSDAGNITSTANITSSTSDAQNNVHVDAPLALQGTTYSILDSPVSNWNWLNIGTAGTTASITATQPGTTLSLGGYSNSPTANALLGWVRTIVNDVIADGTGTMAVNIVGNASGGGGWQYNGSNVVLSAANTYSGGTTLSPGGVLNIANNNALGSGPLTINGGVFSLLNSNPSNASVATHNPQFWNADFQIADNESGFLNMGDGPITINASRTINAGGWGNVTLILGGVIQESVPNSGFGITVYTPSSAPGSPVSVAFGGANTYTGNTVVRGANELVLTNSLALQDSTLDYETVVSGTPTTGGISFGGDPRPSGGGNFPAITSATFGGLMGNKPLLLETNEAVGASTPQGVDLTVGNNNQDTVYSGALSNSGSQKTPGSLEKVGTGALTLSGINTYAGATTVNGGKLYVNGSVAGTGVSVANLATLGGTGTVIGTATVAAGGIIEAGQNGTGTLTLNGLAFSGAGAMNFGALTNYASAVGVNVTDAGALTTTGADSVTIDIASLAGTTPGNSYKLIGYNTSIGGAGFGAFQLGALPNRGTGTLVDTGSEIDIRVGATDYLKWTGAANLSNGWDTSTQNWKLNSTNAPTTYIDNPGDVVVFDDSISNASEATVNITTNVHPNSVTFNNSTYDYTLNSASYGINGPTGLTKTGSGSLTINNANTYTGATQIDGGTVVVYADTALGTPPGLVTPGSIVLNNGTLSAGSGFTLNANRGVALGPASGSGSGTIDTAGGAMLTYAGALANNSGGTGGLNKTGDGMLFLSGANSYTGPTTVTGGTLQYGAASAITTGDLTVTGSTTVLDLQSYSATVGTVTLDGGGTINGTVSSTNNTLAATLTSTGGFELKSGSVTARLAGNVGLDKTTNGVVSLSTLNFFIPAEGIPYYQPYTYTGPTNIKAGTLVIGGTVDWNNPGVLPASTVVTLGDATAGTSGKLVIGSSAGMQLQPVAAIQTAGPGGNIVGGNASSTSEIIVNVAAGTVDTFAGTLGSGTATFSTENNLELIVNGPGTLVLTGNNTYTGQTRIHNGTLVVTSFGTGTGPGCMGGDGGDIVVGAAGNPGKIIYTGTGETTPRGIDFFTGSGATIDQSGSGTLIFTGPDNGVVYNNWGG